MSVLRKNSKGILLLVLSVLFIGYGAYRGEVDTVYTKAIKLCLECVGIG